MLFAQANTETVIVGIASTIVGGGLLTGFIAIVKFLTNKFLAAMEKQTALFTGELRARDAMIQKITDDATVARQNSRELAKETTQALQENTKATNSLTSASNANAISMQNMAQEMAKLALAVK